MTPDMVDKQNIEYRGLARDEERRQNATVKSSGEPAELGILIRCTIAGSAVVLNISRQDAPLSIKDPSTEVPRRYPRISSTYPPWRG